MVDWLLKKLLPFMLVFAYMELVTVVVLLIKTKHIVFVPVMGLVGLIFMVLYMEWQDSIREAVHE